MSTLRELRVSNEVVPSRPTVTKNHDDTVGGRPRGYENDAHPWHPGRVPRVLHLDGHESVAVPHPARTCCVFLVPGTEPRPASAIAATMFAGFERALADIDGDRSPSAPGVGERALRSWPFAAPHVIHAVWDDYGDLAATLPADWSRLSPDERRLYEDLWERRAFSRGKTCAWLLFQSLRLLTASLGRETGAARWLFHALVGIPGSIVFALLALVRPARSGRILADFRLYLDPRGNVERTIVQHIDRRVGTGFLRAIGLGWDFRPLERRLVVAGQEVVFDRVIWVAHGLGSLISFNVLSDLFERARQLAHEGDDEQREGVARFRAALRRFVTLGSPLDKIACLFGERVLRRWPQRRERLLDGGERVAGERREWWVNFYHALDPLSGPLGPSRFFGAAPLNVQTGLWPSGQGGYWRDARVLRYVLGRSYGSRFLRDDGFVFRQRDPADTRPRSGAIARDGAAHEDQFAVSRERSSGRE